MACVKTYDTRLNKDYDITSLQARGLQIALGTLAVTYSAVGGITCTFPFSKTIYAMVPPVSQYVFMYNVTTNMITAYNSVVTTTALASTLVEVASDTDFTACTDSLRFLAFGF